MFFVQYRNVLVAQMEAEGLRYLGEDERRRVGRAALAALKREASDAGAQRPRPSSSSHSGSGGATARAHRRRGGRRGSPFGRFAPAAWEMPAGLNGRAILGAAVAAWVAALTATLGFLGVVS